MAGKRFRDPPVLDDDDDYEEWARKIEIWQMTDFEKNKQGASIYFSLCGRARKCCQTVKLEELGGEDGAKKLLDKLAALYAPDSVPT